MAPEVLALSMIVDTLAIIITILATLSSNFFYYIGLLEHIPDLRLELFDQLISFFAGHNFYDRLAGEYFF